MILVEGLASLEHVNTPPAHPKELSLHPRTERAGGWYALGNASLAALVYGAGKPIAQALEYLHEHDAEDDCG